MSNYSLVINSQFHPFSYQELLQPALMATQAHQALEEAYGNLDTEAAVWDRRTEGFKKAHSLYTNFSKDLASAAETLSKYGLTPQSRKTMLNMKRRYASDITPIVEAWTKRQADIKAQQEAMLRDPYHAFNRVAADTSLDTYLDNPNIDVLSENASGAVLAAQARAMAGDIKNYIDNKNIGKLEKLGLPYQYIQKIIHGATADQVLKTMQGDPEAAPFLHNIVETVMKGSGVRDWSSMNGDWANNPIYKRLESQAMTGLTAAIGTTELRNYTDTFSMQDALNARQHARQRQPQLNNLAINPLNIYSSRELSKDEKKYKEGMERYSKYFYKDSHGQMRMTWAGWQEYTRNATPRPRVTSAGSGSGTARLMNVETQMQNDNKFTPTAFRQFMDSIGAYSVTKGKWLPGNLGNVWNRYANNSPAARTARYDATRATEYDYPIAGAQRGDMKDAIMTAGRGLSLKEVDYDSKSKQFKDTGEEITMEDLKSDKYKVTATRFSPYGNTVMIQDDKGNVRRYRMPAGINTTNEQNRDRAMTAANQWQQVVNTGKYTDARGNTHQATPDEITHAQQQYANSIQQAYLFHSQLGVQNKTKEQEFNPYGY